MKLSLPILGPKGCCRKHRRDSSSDVAARSFIHLAGSLALMDLFFLGWPLKPFEKYLYIGSLIKAIRENIKYPRGLPSFVLLVLLAGSHLLHLSANRAHIKAWHRKCRYPPPAVRCKKRVLSTGRLCVSLGLGVWGFKASAV